MNRSFPTQSLARPYLMAGAVSLILGAFFGVLAALPHGWPQLLKYLPLPRLRPLHTTFSIAWIFLGYMGALFHFLPSVVGRDWPWPRLARLQLVLLGLAGMAASWAYGVGIFSGREYLEFPLFTSAVIVVAYSLFLANFFALVRHRRRPWPAYLWMWATGLVLFPLTFIEGHLYMFSFYGDNPVRDQAVQWKSYGALIGTWNMVIYGLSLYLTERLSEAKAGEPKVGFSAESYLLYWLALVNLLFGFAHHTYSLPEALWLRQLAFVISMSEWVILIHLFWVRVGRRAATREDPRLDLPRQFLGTATFWMILNLLLALLVAIPLINVVTHGTHVTVAHAMGSTIGINTMILWAVGLAAILEAGGKTSARGMRPALWTIHLSLIVFFLSLLGAGLVKGWGMTAQALSFQEAMTRARPVLHMMVLSGTILCLGITYVGVTWLNALRSCYAPIAAASDGVQQENPTTT